MNSRRVTVFVDTNVLLHFKPLSDIDWPQELDAGDVTLVLCAPVLDELDEKKYSPVVAKRADAADRMIHRIEGNEGVVRDGVRLHIPSDLGPADRTGDDAIIADLLQYKNDSDEEVMLVTGDRNLVRRCLSRGVQAVMLDKSHRKPIESEVERKLRIVQEENRALKNRLPQLTLGILPRDMPFAPQNVTKIPLRGRRIGSVNDILGPARDAVPSESVHRHDPWRQDKAAYNRKRARYFEELEKYAEAELLLDQKLARSAWAALWIDNTKGRGGATRVNVQLRFPEKSMLVFPEAVVDAWKHERFDEGVEKLIVHLGLYPVAPKEPRRVTLLPEPHINTLTDYRMPENLSRFGATEDVAVSAEVGGSEIRLRTSGVDNKGVIEVGRVLVLLQSDQIKFNLEYKITCNEFPDVFEGSCALEFENVEAQISG